MNDPHPPVGGGQQQQGGGQHEVHDGPPGPDLRPMEERLQQPFNGVRRAIVVPDLPNNTFEISHGLLNLITNISYNGMEHEDPHVHLRNFTDSRNNKI